MLVQTDAEFNGALETLNKGNPIAVDTETTWTDNWAARRVIGISTYCEIDGEPHSYYFPFRHEEPKSKYFSAVNLPVEDIVQFNLILNNPGKILAFHNAKFDREMLRRDGLLLQNPFYDTMLMSHMCNENGSHALKKLSKLILSEDADHEEKQLKELAKMFGSWERIPAQLMGQYACKDVELTYKLAKHFYNELKKQNLLDLWETEEQFSRCLMEIEARGIRISCLHAQKMSKQAQEELDAIQAHLGFNPMEPLPLANHLYKTLGFMPGEFTGHKSKQFPNGRPIMSEKELLKLDHPDVRMVLRYRGLLKAKATWLDGWVNFCDTSERLHPSFMQHGTKTTRLGCNSPNMHQVPRDERSSPVPVKSLLRATDDFELWEFDYDQVELRLACAYAQDEVMLEAFKNGEDVHQLTANLVGVDRQSGKTLNFAMIYGAGAGKIAELLDVSLEEAREVLEAFHAAYPKLRKVAWNAATFAEQNMYIKFWDGRRRHFEHVYECHKAFNSVVQGGAAVILRRSMLKIREEYKKKDFHSRMVSTVHDSIWTELWQRSLERDKAKIIQIMSGWPEEEFGIPFPVQAKRLAA